MTDTAIAARVARGADWLDQNYPNWWQAIEISTLDVASCHHCVLGQVFTGCIPVGEGDQILAQVLDSMSGFERQAAQESVATGYWGGYNTLTEHHALMPFTAALGFSTSAMGRAGPDGKYVTAVAELAMLTDEWTRVVISRRLAPYRAQQAAQLVAA